MSIATGIIKRLDSTLNKVNANHEKIYKRVTVSSGGDPLTGRGISKTHTDTLLSPQPLYSRTGRDKVGHTAYTAQLAVDANSNSIAAEYKVTFSSSSVSIADLNDNRVTYVFIDPAGNERVFHLTDYETVSMNGIDILYIAYLRGA